MDKKRCFWVTEDPLYINYHDTEWGRPIYDNQLLFEFLILEGMQAGLSWLTILKKRERFRAVFDNFEVEKIAQWSNPKIEQLMLDPGIIRNRLKIKAARVNACAVLDLAEKDISLNDFLWQFVDNKPIINSFKTHREIPVSTKESENMSRVLKEHGFKFVGPTICYAFMQAVGMVMDHTTNCFCYVQPLHIT